MIKIKSSGTGQERNGKSGRSARVSGRNLCIINWIRRSYL